MLLLLLFGSTGLVIALLGIPLARRSIPPNHYYGLRSSATLGDHHIWYEANARHGLDLIGAGVSISFVAFLLYVLRVAERTAAIVNVATLLGLVGGMAYRDTRFANRLWQDRPRARG